MIEELQIRDLGVIQEATLSFHPGLTVLTGETGAGKTMVLTALGLLLGERSDAGAVRKGSNQTSVEGRWKLSPEHEAVTKATDAGALVEDGELILARTVATDGKSRAIIGGRSAPIGLLSELGEQLVVVHGQADQIRLKSAAAQRNALDQFAGVDFAELLRSYGKFYQSWTEAKEVLDDIRTNQAGRLREAAELEESLDYLAKLAPKPNEDVELAELANRLTHTEDLRVAATLAHEALATETFDALDAMGLVGKARKALEAVQSKDSALDAQVDSLREIGSSLNDVAASLSGYLAGLESESGMTIDQVQERRSELNVAIKRFGGSLDAVMAFQVEGQQRLLELDSSTDRIDSIEQLVSELEIQARDLAGKLSSARTKAAQELSLRVSEELAGLAMSGSKLHVRVESGTPFQQLGQIPLPSCWKATLVQSLGLSVKALLAESFRELCWRLKLYSPRQLKLLLLSLMRLMPGLAERLLSNLVNALRLWQRMLRSLWLLTWLRWLPLEINTSGLRRLRMLSSLQVTFRSWMT